MDIAIQREAPVDQPRVLFPGSGGLPFPALAQLVATFSTSDRPELLLFGDSVMERISRTDVDRRTLGMMIADCLTMPTLVVSRSAFNPRLALGLVEALAQLPYRPQQLVLPVNLRSFAPQWDLHPAWTLQQEITAIEEWRKDPARPIRPICDICETPGFFTAYDAIPVAYELSSRRTVGEFRRLVASQPFDDQGRILRAREIFVFHYTHPLVPSHRKLLNLCAVVAEARRLAIEPVLYLTPINIEAGARYVGARYHEIVATNVSVVREVGFAAGVQVESFVDELPLSAFFHEDLATEHLNEHGRRALAAKVQVMLQGRCGS